MALLDELTKRARSAPGRIAFPEAHEEKMMRAIGAATTAGVCLPVLVGDREAIQKAAKSCGISIEAMPLADTQDAAFLEDLIARYMTVNPTNSVKTMRRLSADPLYAALMMEAVGDADFTLGGFTHTSGDFQLAAATVLGMAESFDTLAGFCIFEAENYPGGPKAFVMGDCTVCANPSDRQLAQIAIGACDIMRERFGWDAKCALLSYSTLGSGAGELVDKTARAVKIANELRPELKIDGEFQLDPALDPQAAQKKVRRESAVAGDANILIVPDLNVGNIGIKLLRFFSGIDGYSVMMGLKKPAGDCSRSSPVSEIVGIITVGSILTQGEA